MRFSAAARKAAEYEAARDISRGQMLPHSPDRVPKDLMRHVALAVTESTGSCTLLFDDHGLRAFLDAWHTTDCTTDCTTALRTLRATITDPERYDRIDTDSLARQLLAVLHRHPHTRTAVRTATGPPGGHSGLPSGLADHRLPALLIRHPHPPHFNGHGSDPASMLSRAAAARRRRCRDRAANPARTDAGSCPPP